MNLGLVPCLIGLLHLPGPLTAYRDVYLIHGVMDNRDILNFMAEYIRQKHPGTSVFNLNLYPGIYSLERMWKQVEGFRQAMQRLSQGRDDSRGVHLIGYSQGGLIARGVVQSWDGHNIRSFISLSSPQAGQFGDGFLRLIYPSMVRDEAYRLFYTRYGQKISVANYWNDPHRQKLYQSTSRFLAPINNDVMSEDSRRFRDNMLRLKRLVLIGGPDDEVISPWQSAQFGFYNDNMTVLDVHQRRGYSQDMIGLKTLDKRNGLLLKSFRGVHHHQWHHNVSVIDQAILPYLD